jgi:hypothetical protein
MPGELLGSECFPGSRVNTDAPACQTGASCGLVSLAVWEWLRSSPGPNPDTDCSLSMNRQFGLIRGVWDRCHMTILRSSLCEFSLAFRFAAIRPFVRRLWQYVVQSRRA